MLRQREREVNGFNGSEGGAKSAILEDNAMIKIAASSRARAIAGAIAGILRKQNRVELQSIGAAATNQAVKAIAIANDYLRDDHISICCSPAFMNVVIDGEERTAMRMLVERRPEPTEGDVR